MVSRNARGDVGGFAGRSERGREKGVLGVLRTVAASREAFSGWGVRAKARGREVRGGQRGGGAGRREVGFWWRGSGAGLGCSSHRRGFARGVFGGRVRAKARGREVRGGKWGAAPLSASFGLLFNKPALRTFCRPSRHIRQSGLSFRGLPHRFAACSTV